MSWLIESLSKKHQRTGFSCGHLSLDEFVTKYAGQYERRNLARSYVATRKGETQVLGCYCLSAYAVPFENWPADQTERLPEHPIPIALLGRLAVDQSVHGQGLGGYLLQDVLGRCIGLSKQIGIFAVLAEAIDENAIRFYEHFGFTAFEDQPDKLYLPLRSIPKK
jgi:GNAT superfamily N-acetyltransferase